MTTIIHVAVGSTNPCKVEAVRCAFETIFRGKLCQLMVSSHKVPSGVRDQPYGNSETKLGARNRAQAAWDAARSQHDSNDDESSPENTKTPPPDFAVGIEGGLEWIEDSDTSDKKELWCMCWIAILGSGSENCTFAKADDSPYVANASSKYCGFGKSGCFRLPPEVTRLVVEEKMELGDADDVVFQRVNSKQGEGTVGKLTKGIINRSEYCSHALTLAFVPWIRPELYFPPP